MAVLQQNLKSEIRSFVLPAIVALAVLAGVPALAQRQVLVDPADRSNFWISSINPAVIPHQYSQVALGSEFYNLAFVPDKAFGINEHRVNLSFPFWVPYDLGVGLDLRAFNAPLYSELEASLLLSRRISGPLAFGLKVGIESRSFDQSKFNLIDLNDPVLQGDGVGRSIPNIGAGLYWTAGPFSAGASMDHINRPNLAIDGESLLPYKAAVGLGYRIGAFTPTLLWNEDGFRRTLGFNVTTVVTKLAAVRLSYEQRGPIRLESQFSLSRDSKLSYAINVPNGPVSPVSRGTHQLAYQHILGREPDIGEPLLTMSSNTLNVVHERITRIADASVSQSALRATPGIAPEYVDPNRKLGNVVVVPLSGMREQLPEFNMQEPFRVLGRAAAEVMQENPGNNLAVEVKRENAEDARLFDKVFKQVNPNGAEQILVGYDRATVPVPLDEFESGAPTVEEKAPQLAPTVVDFRILVPGRRRLVKEWKLTIASTNREPIRQFDGKGDLPATIAWDWRDDLGRIVEPGRYLCTLEVLSRQDNDYSSAAEFEVSFTQRNVTLKFTTRAKPNLQSSKSGAMMGGE